MVMAAGVAAGVSAAGGIGGSLIQANAAKSAASEQAAAETNAANLQESQYQQTEANLAPYNATGQSVLPALSTQYQNTGNALTSAYNQAQAAMPNNMLTQAQLVQSPSYQFQLSQGLQAAQNSNASRGLGISGTALKEAEGYSTGLAGTYYTQDLANQNTAYQAANQQFSNQFNAQNAIYNQLQGPATLGANAATSAGQIAQTGAANAGSDIAGAGAAEAAGTQGAGNALANGLNSAASAPLNALLLNQVLTQGTSNGIVDGGTWDTPQQS